MQRKQDFWYMCVLTHKEEEQTKTSGCSFPELVDPVAECLSLYPLIKQPCLLKWHRTWKVTVLTSACAAASCVT